MTIEREPATDREERGPIPDGRGDDYSRFTQALTEVLRAIDRWPLHEANLALPPHATALVLKVEHAAGVLQALNHLSKERPEAALLALDPIYEASARIFDGQVAVLAGAVLVTLDRPEEALRRLDQAFSTPDQPSLSLALTLAGMAHARLGRDKKAAKFLKAAISVDLVLYRNSAAPDPQVFCGPAGRRPRHGQARPWAGRRERASRTAGSSSLHGRSPGPETMRGSARPNSGTGRRRRPRARLPARVHVGIVQEQPVAGHEGQPVDTGRRGDDPVSRVTVEGVGQRVGLLHDLQ